MNKKVLTSSTIIILGIIGWFFLTKQGGETGEPGNWNEISSDHFVVFYNEDPSYASKVLTSAEEHYLRIISMFGFNQAMEENTPASWEWKRCEIFIHQDQDKYNQKVSAASHSEDARRIDAFQGSKKFTSSTLPVQIAELLLQEQVGGEKTLIPRWIREGVAILAENTAMDAWARNIRQAAKDKQQISFDDFNQFDPETSAPHSLQLYSAQAVSVVDYLIKTQGTSAFMELCARFRNGDDLDAALRSIKPNPLSLKKLETNWLEFIAPTSRREEKADSPEFDGTQQAKETEMRRANNRMIEEARQAERRAYRQQPDSTPAEADEPSRNVRQRTFDRTPTPRRIREPSAITAPAEEISIEETEEIEEELYDSEEPHEGRMEDGEINEFIPEEDLGAEEVEGFDNGIPGPAYDDPEADVYDEIEDVAPEYENLPEEAPFEEELPME